MTKESLKELKINKPSKEQRQRVKAVWDGIAKPVNGLGQFEGIIAQIGAIAETTEVDISKRAVIVMCADNGVVEEGISHYGYEMTAIIAGELVKGTTSVSRMALRANADVLPVNIGIHQEEEITGLIQRRVAFGTKNFRQEPAMSEEEALKAIEIGIETVRECKERGYSILATGELGMGNTTTSSAMAAALLGCLAEDVTGVGAGLSKEAFVHKHEVIKEALEKYQFQKEETLRTLKTVGGLDIAGLAGVFIGGALYHIPVVIDGVISAVAALTAERLVPGAKEYMIPSHLSKEPAAKKLLEELDLHPVIDASLALGEGTGAVLMFSLLDTVLSVYEGSSTFDDINSSL
ncbi:nicotinate-nucleotide--dimethylbenzimidazole phosphoribosyltransferase [Anaerocolumna xylanovorans]|uniref:Nicotinate-nucleotide--dimethylbenzimidazole phosphoribosyltransferase n=1 Tax=Anaerocolumna xylanovorans DSM 12503 TaxID=1121345 RepID=A0A1M7XYP7_9FIRM|nr:nicotinate-nucleotide--dimethylbenzimidazole phosphoribosyltransferase [Anaerocolumna xylanovorans]SHO44173.1 nicotinate-nucleotide-dimethylbenzimidazole phosphoribosyltransferase [Anaerocolumna xylanovorans DSM 12503]